MGVTPGFQLPFGFQPLKAVPVDVWSGPFTGANISAGISAANAAALALGALLLAFVFVSTPTFSRQPLSRPIPAVHASLSLSSWSWLIQPMPSLISNLPK